MTFHIPQKCTIDSVNQALIEAGHTDVDIFYDVYNSNNISISYLRHDEFGHPYYTTRQTMYETSKEWAEAFDAGNFEL